MKARKQRSGQVKLALTGAEALVNLGSLAAQSSTTICQTTRQHWPRRNRHGSSSKDGGDRGCARDSDRDRRNRSVLAGGQAHPEIRQHVRGDAGPAQPRGRRRQQFLAHQRRLPSAAPLSQWPDQSPERRQAAAGLDLPDRGQGIDGDVADRHQWRDVCHHLVQPRLRARCAHR